MCYQCVMTDEQDLHVGYRCVALSLRFHVLLFLLPISAFSSVSSFFLSSVLHLFALGLCVSLQPCLSVFIFFSPFLSVCLFLFVFLSLYPCRVFNGLLSALCSAWRSVWRTTDSPEVLSSLPAPPPPHPHPRPTPLSLSPPLRLLGRPHSCGKVPESRGHSHTLKRTHWRVPPLASRNQPSDREGRGPTL